MEVLKVAVCSSLQRWIYCQFANLKRRGRESYVRNKTTALLNLTTAEFRILVQNGPDT